MKAGQSAAVDFPGHPWHGKRVEVVSIEFEFNIAPDGAEPYLAPVVFIRRKSDGEPIGIAMERLAGTAENARLRTEERAANETGQGELLL